MIRRLAATWVAGKGRRVPALMTTEWLRLSAGFAQTPLRATNR